MKKHRNIFKITLTIITAIIFISIGIVIKDVYSISNDKYTETYINENLGLLKNRLNEEEENELKTLFTVKLYLSEKRIDKNNLEIVGFERVISTYIDEILNEYTIKYELEGMEFEWDDSQSTSDKNSTLDKLKNALSKEDYSTLKELCKDYEDGDYSALEVIEDLISKYDSKNSEIITTYLTQSSNLDLGAVFDINKNLGLKYDGIKNITPNELSKSEANTYEKIWNEVRYILPNSDLKKFDKIFFATDGEYNELASVTPNNTEGSKWIINIDPVDVKNDERNLFYETILHEYFHYLSLNDNQVTYTYDYDMNNYCEEGMASKYKSYINEFYNEFWKEIIDDRNIDKENYYFYERHKESFVSEYASTDPAEDIAETFAYFVLNDKPSGNSVKDKKIKFFYQYDELVKLKKELQEKINSQGEI